MEKLEKPYRTRGEEEILSNFSCVKAEERGIAFPQEDVCGKEGGKIEESCGESAALDLPYDLVQLAFKIWFCKQSFFHGVDRAHDGGMIAAELAPDGGQ